MNNSSPNIVIFHCDQLRFDSLGCNGHPGDPTPNIDRLAREGVSLQRHFTASAICMPSRASFFTGLPVTAHGVWSNGVPLNRREYMPFGAWGDNSFGGGIPEPLTLADFFTEQGYATGAFGKLHLTPTIETSQASFPESQARWKSGEQDDWRGPYFGFQHVELTHAHGEIPGGHYDVWLKKNHPELYEKAKKNEKEAHRPIKSVGDLHRSVLTPETHPSTWVGNQALDWIEKQSGKPFLTFLGFPDPHHAFVPIEEDLAIFENREMPPPIDANGELRNDIGNAGQDVKDLSAKEKNIIRQYTAAMVRRIDIVVGNVMDQLKANGLYDNTIFVFTSDHGDYLCDYGLVRKSHKASKPLLHVPCIIKTNKDQLLNRSNIQGATSNIDIFPTLLDLANFEIPNHLQGKSWADENLNERYAFAHGFTGDLKEAHFTILDERFRYTLYPHDDRIEFFDHIDDPYECHNRFDDQTLASERKRLHAALAENQLKAVNPISGRMTSW